MVMADFTTENTDNVVNLSHRVYLKVLRAAGRMDEFCRFVWPDGVQEGARFRIDPNFPAFILVRGDRTDVGNVYVGQTRTGVVFDLIDERDTGASAEELFDDFIRTLPPSEPADHDDELGEGTCPAMDWDRKFAPERQWLVKGWLPLGTVTSLYGGAGFGKSLVAQQLATAVANGRPFLGLETVKGQVMFVACEDDDGELQRRQESINRSMGMNPHDHVMSGLMRNFARAGKNNVMAQSGRDGGLRFRRFFQEVRDRARDLKVSLLILDNIAQLFGGNENARPEVTQFVNALTGIAVELNCAVLLLGHPGKATDSEYSGSTAWDAAVRSRWTLTRAKTGGMEDDNESPNLDDMRVLRKSKANYASTGDEIKLIWDNGAFRLDAPETGDAVDKIEVRARNRDRDARVLAGLRGLLDQGYEPSPREQARTTFAPTLIRERRPELRDLSRAAIRQSLNRLMDDGKVVLGVTRGPPSRQKELLVPAGHPLAKAPSCNGTGYHDPENFNHHDPYEQPTSRGS